MDPNVVAFRQFSAEQNSVIGAAIRVRRSRKYGDPSRSPVPALDRALHEPSQLCNRLRAKYLDFRHTRYKGRRYRAPRRKYVAELAVKESHSERCPHATFVPSGQNGF